MEEPPQPTSKVRISGVDVDVIDIESLLGRIDDYIRSDTSALVNYVNVHGMNLAHTDPAFREILNKSEVVFCDGFGVKLGARILGLRVGQRMTPPDWIDLLFERCADAGQSIYFVGDEAQVIDAFVAAVRERHPSLELVGSHHGFFPLDGPEAAALVDDLRDKKPDLVITGMGMPRQEQWARDVRAELQQSVYLATGALFRWYSGHDRRAPRWVSDHGFEWLARLVTSPKQLWRRYLVGNPRFILRVLLQRMRGDQG